MCAEGRLGRVAVFGAQYALVLGLGFDVSLEWQFLQVFGLHVVAKIDTSMKRSWAVLTLMHVVAMLHPVRMHVFARFEDSCSS
jgi:hypothetical protein